MGFAEQTKRLLRRSGLSRDATTALEADVGGGGPTDFLAFDSAPVVVPARSTARWAPSAPWWNGDEAPLEASIDENETIGWVAVVPAGLYLVFTEVFISDGAVDPASVRVGPHLGSGYGTDIGFVREPGFAGADSRRLIAQAMTMTWFPEGDSNFMRLSYYNDTDAAVTFGPTATMNVAKIG